VSDIFPVVAHLAVKPVVVVANLLSQMIPQCFDTHWLGDRKTIHHVKNLLHKSQTQHNN